MRRLLHALSREKSRSPLDAPPLHTPVKLPVGQMARAARTHCPHFRFDTVMDPPSNRGFSSNLAEPDCPVVFGGAPLQPVESPEMLPQMDSCAVFSS
jgi:hypothetical protein